MHSALKSLRSTCAPLPPLHQALISIAGEWETAETPSLQLAGCRGQTLLRLCREVGPQQVASMNPERWNAKSKLQQLDGAEGTQILGSRPQDPGPDIQKGSHNQKRTTRVDVHVYIQ